MWSLKDLFSVSALLSSFLEALVDWTSSKPQSCGGFLQAPGRGPGDTCNTSIHICNTSPIPILAPESTPNILRTPGNRALVRTRMALPLTARVEACSPAPLGTSCLLHLVTIPPVSDLLSWGEHTAEET